LYGSDKLTLDVPDNIRLGEYDCRRRQSEYTESDFIDELSRAEKSVFDVIEADLIVVNDAYRPTPTARILDWLDKNGRLNDTVRFMIATGTHQAPSDTQLREIFGPLHDKIAGRILVHDCRREEDMVEVGRDGDDEPVLLNRHFVEAEKSVAIGSVEPHYFAGYTGGRKSIFPGVCDFETTARNHRHAVSFEAMPMKLKGNPVSENLDRLMQCVSDKTVFGIQIVGSHGGGIYSITCGGLADSYECACGLAAECFGHKVDERYDLVLAEVYPPLNLSLYQLQKSLENCQPAIADGGTVILFSPCREGIGSRAFYDLADRWQTGTLSAAESFGIHKLRRVHDIGERTNVYLYSELDDGISDRVYFKTTKYPGEIIESLAEKTDTLHAALVHDAGHTVLTMQ
jgi:nickel-dependent lactate racemase